MEYKISLLVQVSSLERDLTHLWGRSCLTSWCCLQFNY